MNRSILSRGSILLVLLMLFNTMSIGFANTVSITNAENLSQVTDESRLFDVHMDTGSGFELVESLAADEYFRDYSINLPETENTQQVSIMITKQGGGLAHLDMVSVDGYNLSNFDQDENLLYKLTETDHDVVELTTEGAVFLFTGDSQDGPVSRTLHINGRIEPEVLGTNPFSYPRGNDTNRIHSGSNFYVYSLDSNYGTNVLDGDITDVEGMETLFKVLDVPASGHPSGYTYGWMMNDEEYLYAIMDFTPDNTFDGDKDYASLYIDTSDGVKQFTVSEADTSWGRPSFTYSSQVGYQHKVYEFKIPLSELGQMEDEYVKVAFTAYGTAVQQLSADTDVAYASSTNEYLVVYQMTDSGSGQTGIFGQRVNYDGTPTGSTIMISPFSPSNPMHPKVVYNSVNDHYLVVWDIDIGVTRRIQGTLIGTDGSLSGITSFLDDIQYSAVQDPSMEYREKPDLAYSDYYSTYAVVWQRSSEIDGTYIEGSIVDNGLSPTTKVQLGTASGDTGAFDISYNKSRYTYTLAYELITGPNSEIYYSEFNKYGSIVSIENRISPIGETSLNQPNVTHNKNVNDEFVTWIDSSLAPQRLKGIYKNVSASAIEISSNVYFSDRTTALSKGEMSSEMLVVWPEVFFGDGTMVTLYAQLFDDMGAPIGSPNMMYNDMGTIDHVSVAYNGISSYLVAFVHEPEMGDPVVTIMQYGPTDSGELDFNDISLSVSEGSTVTLQVDRKLGYDGTVTVDYATSDITAGSADYTASTGTVTLASGQDSATITISTTDDLDVEGNESFQVTLSNPTGGASLGTNVIATVEIVDDDFGEEIPPSVIEFDPYTELSVPEGVDFDVFLSRTGDLSGSVSVDYETIIGTATSGDFVYAQGTVTFGDQVDTQTITIATSEDQVEEQEETFTIELTNPIGATIGTNDTATVTIYDDFVERTDGDYDPEVTYASSISSYFMVYEAYDATTNQSAIMGQFYDNTGTASGSAITVVPASDYAPWMPTVTYNSTDDEFLVAWTELVAEGDISHFKILDISGNTVVSSQPVVSETNEVHYGVSAAYNPLDNNYCLVWDYRDMNTNNESVAGIIVDSARTKDPLQMTVSGEAHNPYVVFNTTDSTFDVAYIGVTGEKTEILTSVFDGSGAPVSENEPLAYSLDNQYEPILTHNDVIQDDYVVWGESGASDTIFGQYKASSGSAIAIASGNVDVGDYVKPKSLLSLSDMRLFWIEKDPELLDYKVMTQKINDDNTLTESSEVVDSDPESFSDIGSAYDFELGNHLVAYGYETTSGSSIRVALIVDGDVQEPTITTDISMSVSTESVTEGSSVQILVERVGEDLSGTDTIDYTTSHGTADDTDYTASSGTLTFTSGQYQKTITIETIDDTTDESDETFTVTLSNPTGDATLVTPTQTLVTIVDDDEVVEPLESYIAMTQTAMTTAEGDPATLFLERTGDLSGSDTISYTTSHGTADSADYTVSTGTVTFEPGVTSGSIVISTTSDSSVEEDETFTVTLSNPTGNAILSSPTVTTVTIIDDDVYVPVESYISMAQSVMSTPEGDSVILYVQRTGDLSGTDSIDYASSNGTADSSDYTPVTGTMIFDPNVESMTISIDTSDDTDVETDETFTVTLSNPTGSAILDSPESATVTIVDDDVEVVIETFIGMVSSIGSVQEGQTAQVYVQRTGEDLSGTDTVDYTTSHGTAGADDYETTSGTITFASGEYMHAIPVTTVSDTDDEDNETFTVTLSNPGGDASLDEIRETQVTIIDDDIEAIISLTLDTALVEEGGEAVVYVQRTGNLHGTDTVSYVTTFGTAGSADYTSESGVLTFNPGDTSGTIAVHTTDDTDVEGDEIFEVSINTPTGNAVLGEVDTALVTIVDNDFEWPDIQFELESITISEGNSATINVVRTGDYMGEVVINYTLTHGTTTSSDIVDMSGILTFAEGETTQTFTISTIENSRDQINRVFAIEITAEVTEYIGEIGVITVTILDDDPARRDDDNKPNTSEPTDTTDTTDTTAGGTDTTSEPERTVVEDTASKEEVEQLASAIKEALESQTETISVNVAQAFLDDMQSNIEEIEDETVLADSLTSYVETIQTISNVGNAPDQQEWVESQVVKISDVVTKSLQKMQTDEKVVEVATKVIAQIKQVEVTTEVKQTAEVKNKVAELAQSVLTKVSEVKVAPTVEVVDGVSEVKFDKTALAENIAQKAQNFTQLTNTFNEFYGDDNVREFDFEVTLVTDRVSDQMQVPIDKDTINTLNQSGVDSLSVAVGGTTVTIGKEIYSEEPVEGEEPGEAPDLVVDMNFNDQGFDVQDEKINFKAGIVTDVKVYLDQEEKKTLEKPVELKFNLDDFEFWDPDASPSSLSIFRLNEETGDWDPVGGIYDPVTNTVKTRRITLSQYTVMQSNKAFSDVETSWAKDEINELLGKGIIDETASFNPEETISREEFTTWVARAYGVVTDEADAPFADIPQEHEHYEELASAYNAGIISGGGDGNFNPEAAMTKEQMSAILANAMTQYDDMKLNEGLKGTLASASDADLVSDWAGDDIAMLVELGVIDNSSGEINPQQQLTKEEAASILKKIYG